MDPLIGQIMMVAFNFTPKGWAMCNGQLLSVSQYSALFSLLGTAYGGDGVTTFALPNLQGRVPIHMGHGAGLSNYEIGQQAGFEQVTLTVADMPHHSHALAASSIFGELAEPNNNFIAPTTTRGNGGFSESANTVMAGASIVPAGGNQPHSNIQPYLTVNFIIALEGIYPPRA